MRNPFAKMTFKKASDNRALSPNIQLKKTSPEKKKF